MIKSQFRVNVLDVIRLDVIRSQQLAFDLDVPIPCRSFTLVLMLQIQAYRRLNRPGPKWSV